MRRRLVIGKGEGSGECCVVKGGIESRPALEGRGRATAALARRRSGDRAEFLARVSGWCVGERTGWRCRRGPGWAQDLRYRRLASVRIGVLGLRQAFLAASWTLART